MSGVYRRHRERAGSGWGVWLLVIGIVGVIAVAVLVVFLVRGKSGGNLPGGLVVTPQGSLVDTGEMTEREFFEFLRSKGAKVNYGGNGFLFHEDDHPLAAKEFGYIGFCNHPNIESARRYAGDTATGFHWQRWSFVPMRGQSVRHGVA